MSEITLYEKVNIEKLNQVLLCGNIPSTDPEWFKVFQKQLLYYSRMKYTKNGFKITYKQTNGYGRFTACCLQSFQKDIRKYISGECYEDIDMVNCHPVLLEQLFEKYDMNPPKFLIEYNKDRAGVIKKYQIKDKQTIISLINNQNAVNKYKEIMNLHKSIYDSKNGLLPKLTKDYKHI